MLGAHEKTPPPCEGRGLSGTQSFREHDSHPTGHGLRPTHPALADALGRRHHCVDIRQRVVRAGHADAHNFNE